MRIAIPYFAFVLFTVTPVAQAQDATLLRAYEFESTTLQDNGWIEIPGGFESWAPGVAELAEFPADTFASPSNGQGLAITVAPGEVTLLYAAEPVVLPDQPFLLRMTVRASSPWASVALIALRGDLANGIFVDGSLGLNMPASSEEFVASEARLAMIYEPLGAGIFTPALQIVGVGTAADEIATVWIDKVEILSVEPGPFGSYVGLEPSTPVPTPTPTPHPEIPTYETITVPLDLPDGAVPLEMVRIPAGSFLMGSPDDEQNRRIDESPYRRVTISQDYYMGKYEVTQAQYQAVMGSNPSRYMGDNRPIEQVSWFDAARFCNRLSEIMGRQPVYNESNWSADISADGFRLPTEAEWEYACRAGTTTRFYWGDDPSYIQIGEYAWYNYNANTTSDVGLKRSNAFGLFDMSGNVDEWCQDWYGPYPNYSEIDPLGPQSGVHKVLRGGSFSLSEPRFCRSAFRHDGRLPNDKYPEYGFRIARFVHSPVVGVPPTPTPVPQPGNTITVQLDLPEGVTPLEMVLIPSGEFIMGSPPDEVGRWENEGPQRRVLISRDFYMGKYPITIAQYHAFRPNHSSGYPPDSTLNQDDQPVVIVSWFSAARFCNYLSELHGFTPVYNESNWTANMSADGFRLPTEAEWEYAARAGTTTRRYWGDDLNDDQACAYANVMDLTDRQEWEKQIFIMFNCNDGYRDTSPVGRFLPNQFGLYDMLGNVAEWCQDWFGPYPNYDEVDPLGPASGVYRITRGGSSSAGPRWCRSATRNTPLSPTSAFSGHGFRIVRNR